MTITEQVSALRAEATEVFELARQTRERQQRLRAGGHAAEADALERDFRDARDRHRELYQRITILTTTRPR